MIIYVCLLGLKSQYQSHIAGEGEFNTPIEISAPQNYLRHLDRRQPLWSGIWPVITAAVITVEWKVCLFQPASNETPTEGLYHHITITTLFLKLGHGNRSRDGLKACMAVTLLLLHPAIQSHHGPGLNLCRVLSQQAKSLQKSPLFLSVFGLKCGVSPGCGSTAMHALTHACAPTLSCTCAHKSTHWPICFPGADSRGVKWKHLTNSKKLREKKRGRRGGEKGRGELYNFTVEWNLLKELSCQDVRKEDQYSSVSMQ